MKIPMIIISLALWIGYACGHDKFPVPKWNHILIHALYAGCFIGAVMMP